MRLRCLLVLIAAVSLASADTLTLRNGKTVQGSYLGGSSRQIRMAVGDAIQTFDVGDVLSLSFEGQTASAPQPAPAPAAVPAPAVQATSSAPAGAAVQPVVQTQPETSPAGEPVQPASGEQRKILHVESEQARATAPVAASAGVELPAGTNITIRMVDDVDSKQAQVGQTFRATVDDPVMLGDRVAIPKGADVVTKLVDLQEPGKIAGGGQLTLGLVSINVNGKPVDVTTQTVSQAGESGKKDSAKVIGGTAALGAIIGAIAGGGKGAALGGIAGAGAGTAVRVITSGAQVRIPSETRLTFALQQPVRL